MNLIKPLSLALAIFFSVSASAKVTVEIPSSIDLLVVNGEKPSTSGSLFSSTKNLDLEDGENQIVFRFEQFFTQGDDRMSVESDVVIAKFTASNKELTFLLPKYKDAKSAKKDIKQFEWSLVDNNQQKIDVKQERLIKKGMQLGRNYPQEALEYNRTGAIASVAIAGEVALASVPENASSDTAEEMLHFWYNKADEATKQRFKQFVNAQ